MGIVINGINAEMHRITEVNCDVRLRQQQLEDRHSHVEFELRRLMAIPGLMLASVSHWLVD